MRVTAALFVFASLVPAVGDAQISNLRPGQYEITLLMDMAMPNAPKEPVKRLECLTADDLKDASRIMGGGQVENCRITDVRTIGNKTSFNTSCIEEGEKTGGPTEITFGTDALSGVSSMKDDKGRVVTMRMSARRVGECRK